VGEFLGSHTVAELKDMLAVATYEAERMRVAETGCIAWLQADPHGFQDWSGRLTAVLARLPSLVAQARDVIDSTPSALEAVWPAGSTYEALLAWRRDLSVLDSELRTGGHGCAPATYADMPQPTAPDPDLQAFKGAQAVTKPIDTAIASAKHFAESRTPWVVAGLVGGVALILFLRK
jgi:hypothetical protein